MHKNTPILIVGAGPVGLTVALSLHRQGIPIRIIDRNEQATPLSKALVLWRRSLLSLDPLIPFETFLVEGIRAQNAHFFDEGLHQATLPFLTEGHGLPPGIFIPQSRIEAILVEALLKGGITVERNAQLERFSQDAEGITAEMTQRGKPETLRARYLIAADGGRSTTRHLLGLTFQGESMASRWLLGDITVTKGPAPASIETDVAEGDLFMSSSPEGAIAIFPISKDRFRIIVDGGSIDNNHPPKDPTAAELQRAISERTRLEWMISETHWLSEFRINERQIDHYIHGRVLIAGDAAHVHSPAGGQGMNTGIQDAVNLGFRLATVCHGAHPRTIERYQAERHPVARHVLTMSGRMLRAGMLRQPILRKVRGHIMSLLLKFPPLKRMISDALTEDDVSYEAVYKALKGGKEAWLGQAFPDLKISCGAAHIPASHLLRSQGPLYGTLLLGPSADPKAWPTTHLGLPIRQHQLGSKGLDDAGVLQHLLTLKKDEGMLIRPDAIIDYKGSAEGLTSWLSAL